MNTRLNTLTVTSAALLMSIAWSGDSIAQQSSSTMPTPDTDRGSCAEIDWHRDLVREYPWVGDACQEAIIVNGQKWARFEAEFQQFNRDGTITSNFRDARGRSLGSVKLQPGSDQRVLLDGRATRFSDLRRGQVLNFYAPEGLYAFAMEPGATPAEQVQIVRQPTAPAREEAPRQLAQAPAATTSRQRALPATAGPLPLFALGGLLSLLGGIGLTTRRRFQTPNA